MTPIETSRKTIAAPTDLPAPATMTAEDDGTAHEARRLLKVGVVDATVGQGTRVAIAGPVTNPIAGHATNGVATPVKKGLASASDADLAVTTRKAGAVKGTVIAAARKILPGAKGRAAIEIAALVHADSGIAAIIAVVRRHGHIAVSFPEMAARWAAPAHERWEAVNRPTT